jgi:hypothetical protein
MRSRHSKAEDTFSDQRVPEEYFKWRTVRPTLQPLTKPSHPKARFSTLSVQTTYLSVQTPRLSSPHCKFSTNIHVHLLQTSYSFSSSSCRPKLPVHITLNLLVTYQPGWSYRGGILVTH